LSPITIAYFLYLLSVEEKYNAEIDSILSTSTEKYVTFEPTPERIDEQLFDADSSWQQVGDAYEITQFVETLEVAGYSQDLEGFIEAHKYVPHYFRWTTPRQNALNLARARFLRVQFFARAKKGYYYEQEGDITHIYFPGLRSYQVFYEAESTIFAVNFINEE